MAWAFIDLMSCVVICCSYACYVVLLKRVVTDPEAMEIPMFFGENIHTRSRTHIHTLLIHTYIRTYMYVRACIHTYIHTHTHTHTHTYSGFVGLFDALAILPLVIVWHYTGIEDFQLPPTTTVWTLLLVNGFIGTVLSELLWLL